MAITLKKPINAHGEEVRSLDLRDPTGDDLVKSGLPFSIEMTGKVVVDMASVDAWISTLASIPPSSVKQLGFTDKLALMAKVIGFFLAAIPELSGMITLPLATGGATSDESLD